MQRRLGNGLLGSLLVMTAGLVGCTTNDGGGSTASTASVQGAIVVDRWPTLPLCTLLNRGAVYYVKAENELVYCDGSRYQSVAAGIDGKDGVTWLVTTSPATPLECPAGGVVIKVGPDADRDGSLDRVAAESAVCNGANGKDGAPGNDGASGRDGNPGAAGTNGLTSLIRQTAEPAGEQCPAGGIKIESGIDANGDGSLSANEVSQTSYLCRPEADLPTPDVSSGLGGTLGTIGGTTGMVSAHIIEASPSILSNTLDTTGAIFARDVLSPGGKRLFDLGAGDDSTTASRVMSFEILGRSEGAKLWRTKDEIVCDTPGSKCSSVDYIADFAGVKLAVFVWRAFSFPFGTPPDVSSVSNRVAQKLGDIALAHQDAGLENRWRKSILHVMAYDQAHAAAVLTALGSLDAVTLADTIVMVTRTIESNYIY